MDVREAREEFLCMSTLCVARGKSTGKRRLPLQTSIRYLLLRGSMLGIHKSFGSLALNLKKGNVSGQKELQTSNHNMVYYGTVCSMPQSPFFFKLQWKHREILPLIFIGCIPLPSLSFISSCRKDNTLKLIPILQSLLP